METHTPVVLSSPLYAAPGIRIPRLVAHRGYAARFPENTLLALHQALKCGACYLEFDVQFSSDGIPLLFHDETLERTTGHSGRIMDLPYAQLRTLQACETARFGRAFANTGIGIPTLAEAVYLLKNWPQAHAFVELKEESFATHGIEYAVKTLVKVLQPTIAQCTVISYNDLAIRCARAMGARSIGWVIKDWDNESRGNATNLTPDYIFCNYRKIPFASESLWRGPWKWALYEVTDPELALALATRGVDLIETMEVGDMLEHPILRQGGCFDGCIL
jgi:glycerophosphoryl diester phosphodiesterase